MYASKKKSSPGHPASGIFSKRQLDVIECWGHSFDPALVAQEMEIKVSTVQTHLRRMRKKLGAKRTVEVWEYASGLHKKSTAVTTK